MRKQIARLLLPVLALFCIVFIIIVINQTAQVVQLAARIAPWLGQVVLYALLVIYALLILAPILIIVRLPRALQPPPEDSPEYDAYLKQLAKRLSDNPHLAGANLPLQGRSAIQAALNILDAKAGEVIRNAGATIFVSTAISQNGLLDALMVLMAQSRMVWEVTHIYNQRPSLREILKLYANVAATALLASEIEDLDLNQQVEPVIASALGGTLASAVPGVSIVATILVNSILEGTANAYLTLRVGIICQEYCAAPDRRAMRKRASVKAAGMLGALVLESSKAVSNAILGAAKEAGVGALGSVANGVCKGTQSLAQRLSGLNPLRRRVG